MTDQTYLEDLDGYDPLGSNDQLQWLLEGDGRLLVHNHVRPEDDMSDVIHGWHGFRAWLTADHINVERCFCGWAPQLQRSHYRMIR